MASVAGRGAGIVRGLIARFPTETVSRAEYVVHLLTLATAAWLLFLPFLTYFQDLNAFAKDL